MPRPRIPEALCGGASCESKKNTSKPIAFEVSSTRRRGFPSETVPYARCYGRSSHKLCREIARDSADPLARQTAKAEIKVRQRALRAMQKERGR